MCKLEEQLARYMDAGFPILCLDTFEEDKADAAIRAAAGGRDILEWSVRGFRDCAQQLVEPDWSLSATLELLASDEQQLLVGRVLVLKDAAAFLDDPWVVGLLKHLAQRIHAALNDFNIIIVAAQLKIPPQLENYLTLIAADYLSKDEICKVIGAFCAEQQLTPLQPQFVSELALTFKGLSEFEIRSLLALALSDNGEITRSDLALIFEQKKQVVQKSGILEMIPLRESLEDVGGLGSLRKWLQRKEKIFRRIDEAAAFGVAMPKGVLIAGLPGCGKSLNAKAAAQLFNVPLLRMDMGRLLGKYVGESEGNLRRALRLAEAISPCVLWIDELEKAFAGIGGEGGAADVATRLFDTFLTWLQEKDSLAFVVATANDISRLPPELLRKGRFDEIFYVGLPQKAEREKIFRIHIHKRRPADLSGIDLTKLADATDGYSGADIEGVVKDSVEEAFTQGHNKITTQTLLEAISNTHSLSEIMKDSLDKLQAAYQQRKFKNASQ